MVTYCDNGWYVTQIENKSLMIFASFHIVQSTLTTVNFFRISIYFSFRKDILKFAFASNGRISFQHIGRINRVDSFDIYSQMWKVACLMNWTEWKNGKLLLSFLLPWSLDSWVFKIHRKIIVRTEIPAWYVNCTPKIEHRNS